jgi:redox-sensing transcriptional repressor
MAHIPEPAKERLLYLMRLLEKSGTNREPAPNPEGAKVPLRITSAEVEQLTGWSSYTIRKDISYLGGFEGNAVGNNDGYDPCMLVPAIREALGLGGKHRFCVVGLGRLGSAYLNFAAFERQTGSGVSGFGDSGEFELAAGFDTNVNRVEILKSPVPLYPAYKVGEVITRFGIEMALLCVPGDAAQNAADKLAAAGIRGIVNFAPVALRLPPDIIVRNVYVVDELRALAVKLNANLENKIEHETKFHAKS